MRKYYQYFVTKVAFKRVMVNKSQKAQRTQDQAKVKQVKPSFTNYQPRVPQL